MWKRVNFSILALSFVNSAETSKRILSVDIHGTRATDTLSARPPEGERGVNLVLDFNQRVENL